MKGISRAIYQTFGLRIPTGLKVCKASPLIDPRLLRLAVHRYVPFPILATIVRQRP